MLNIRIPEKEVSSKFEEVEEYNHLCRKYLYRWGYKAVLDCLSRAGLSEGEIVDLGTGSAVLAIELIKMNKKYLITGIDLSEEMLGLARKNAQEYIGNINFIKSDVKSIPINDDFFDAAVSYASLHHWSGNPIDVFKETYRLVKNNGLIAIFDLKREEKNLSFIRSIPFQIMRKCAEASLRASYTPFEMREILSKESFTKNWEVVENPLCLGIIGRVAK